MVQYMKSYRKRYAKKYGRTLDAGKYPKLRKRVLDFLGGPSCVNCSCDVYALLEINHRNGGGGKHIREKGVLRVLYDILSGRLPKKDVEVTCRVCNALHYVVEILKVKGHRVLWKPA